MHYNSLEAQKEMITECRAQCRGVSQDFKAIDIFKRTYCSKDVLHWYTKPCFLYRLVNKALRSSNILDRYIFRYFVVDLYAELEKIGMATKSHYTTPFYVYRGANFSRDEVEQLGEGTLVATKGFFSSTLDLEVAKCFISIDPNTGMSPSRGRNEVRQFVLFHIFVDLNQSFEPILADVSNLSAVPDENEMIFNLGTTFCITHIYYDKVHYVWHIEMNVSTEVAQLKNDYSNYILKRLTEINARLLFGKVLGDMSNDLIGALRYFHRLLRKIPIDDEDRPSIYFQLGYIYHCMNKRQQGIVYCRCAYLLHRRRLPQSKLDYARTLLGLGVFYSDLGQSKRALHWHTQAIMILRSILPEDHIEIAHVTNKLAYAYWQEKQYDHANKLLATVLSFFKRKMPTNHPAEAETLHTMGLVQRALGNREQAIDYLKQALRIRQLLLADNDPAVAWTAYELSIVYAERDDEKTIALEYAKNAMHIQQIRSPPNYDELKRSVDLVEQLSTYNHEM